VIFVMEYNIIFCPTLFVGNKIWESEVQHLIPKVMWNWGCGIVHENSFGIDFDMDFGV